VDNPALAFRGWATLPVGAPDTGGCGPGAPGPGGRGPALGAGGRGPAPGADGRGPARPGRRVGV